MEIAGIRVDAKSIGASNSKRRVVPGDDLLVVAVVVVPIIRVFTGRYTSNFLVHLSPITNRVKTGMEEQASTSCTRKRSQ